MQHGIAKQPGQHKCRQAKAQAQGHHQRVGKLKNQATNAKHQQGDCDHDAHIGQGGGPELAKGQPVQCGQAGCGVPADATVVGRLKTGKDGQVVLAVDRPDGCAV